MKSVVFCDRESGEMAGGTDLGPALRAPSRVVRKPGRSEILEKGATHYDVVGEPSASGTSARERLNTPRLEPTRTCVNLPPMDPLPPPLAFCLLLFSGWINRQQQAVIEYRREENRVLRAAYGPQRVRITDDQHAV